MRHSNSSHAIRQTPAVSAPCEIIRILADNSESLICSDRCRPLSRPANHTPCFAAHVHECPPSPCRPSNHGAECIWPLDPSPTASGAPFLLAQTVPRLGAVGAREWLNAEIWFPLIRARAADGRCSWLGGRIDAALKTVAFAMHGHSTVINNGLCGIIPRNLFLQPGRGLCVSSPTVTVRLRVQHGALVSKLVDLVADATPYSTVLFLRDGMSMEAVRAWSTTKRHESTLFASFRRAHADEPLLDHQPSAEQPSRPAR